MAAVKLGSQPFGEVLLLVKWLQGPNFVDYCIIRQMKRPTKKHIWGLKVVQKWEDMQCLKLRSVLSKKQPLQQAFSPPNFWKMKPTSWGQKSCRSDDSRCGGCKSQPGISMTTWNLLKDGNMKSSNLQIFRFFSRKSSNRFSLANRDFRVRKGSNMSQLTVICVNLEAKAQIVNCLHGIAYRDQYHRNASFLRSDMATRLCRGNARPS